MNVTAHQNASVELKLDFFFCNTQQYLFLDPQIESGYHSAVQESALVISLQMFNLMINRCVQLLRDQLQQMKKHPDRIDWHYPLIVSADVQILLPAIKVSDSVIVYYLSGIAP